ncbi:MAG: DUF3046 domain-containing protein [Rhodoglobus sp.]
MRLSEFRTAVTDEFGEYGRVIVRDLVLTAVGGHTAEEAIALGVPPRDIWLALCAAADVPLERRHGVGQRAVELGESRQRFRAPSAG